MNDHHLVRAVRLEDCWAKTNPQNGLPCLSVVDHCLIVGQVSETLFRNLYPSIRKLLPSGCVTLVAAHDVGKLTPGFQLKAPSWPWHEELRQSVIADNLCTNHAVVSQWHLQQCPALKENRNAHYWLISTGGHHGSYPSGLRLMKRPPYEGGNHSFIALREELLQILIARFGPLPVEDAKNEIERIHLLTGFTIFCDWIGSNADWFPPLASTDETNLTKITCRVLKDLNWNPAVRHGVSFGAQFSPDAPVAFQPREIQSALLAAADAPGLYIVEAPMGMGKTEAALTTAYQRWTQGDERGLYFALPTQLTSNKIHDRIYDFLGNTLGEETTQTLIHGNAWLKGEQSRMVSPAFRETGKEPPENEHNDASEALRWYSSTRKQLIAPFGTGTIDQALLAVLPARFAALRYFALAGKVVVIDEVHSFDPYMSALIDRLIRYLLKAGSTLIILSATLTAQRRAELVQAAGASEDDSPAAYPLITKVATGSTQAIHVPVAAKLKEQMVILKHDTLTPENEDAFWQSIAEKVEAGANVVVIRNSVALAQNTYLDLKSRLTSRILPEHIGLIHSRFPQNEREQNEGLWTGILGKNEALRPQGSLLVATQIVEQSVDIDADCLITDLAPTELILQRIGRLHRHERKRPAGFDQAVCHILHPETCWQADAKSVKSALHPHHWIYPPLSLWQASQTLKPLNQIKLPEDIRPLLERSAGLEIPEDCASPALLEFADEAQKLREKMQGTAATRDIFTNAHEDVEGKKTRFGIKPTANLIVLPKFPVEQGGRITWHLPSGVTQTTRIGEFNYPLAKLLHQQATRIPAYLVKDALHNAPDWLRQHIDSAVLATPNDDSTELRLFNVASASHTLHYRIDLGITFQKNETIPEHTDPDDFWF